MPREVKGAGVSSAQMETSLDILQAKALQAGEKLADLHQQQNIRLECLRLANIPGRQPSEVVDRAKQFEAYVNASA